VFTDRVWIAKDPLTARVPAATAILLTGTDAPP